MRKLDLKQRLIFACLLARKSDSRVYERNPMIFKLIIQKFIHTFLRLIPQLNGGVVYQMLHTMNVNNIPLIIIFGLKFGNLIQCKKKT